MTIRSPNGAQPSDSFFDSPPDPTSCISSITEWRKDIPTPTLSGVDFPFSSDFQDMNSSDLFELKDTVSECSMDSAYQSQSGASRRGEKKPYTIPQDNRSASAQFVGNEIYSPSLSSENYNAFQDPAMDMNQMQQTVGTWDAPEDAIVYANYSAAQDYSPYSSANVARYTPTSAASMSSPWVPADAQFQNSQFTFTSAYPAGQSSTDMMFNTTASSQRQWSNSHFDTSDRPTAVRSSSSFTLPPPHSRRTSTHDANFGAFVATPTSTTSIHFPQNVDFDLSRVLNPRNDTEDTTSNSLPTQSLDDNEEITSTSDAAETKLEEERTKVARSHPLYQQLPDKDGKYHCPEEGKAGCSHKPTPLKCNYDKYVDSHLKPFRCNKKTCVGVQFSSTACLLRHEREAHGMHGHGARPHLCHFGDCERAVPGHGFPRRYNLFDHMKRVHQYEGSTTEPSPPTAGQVQRKTVTRKRKASTEDASEKRQKAAKISAEQQRQQACDLLTEQFLSKKQYIIDILSNLSSPNDLGDDIQLTKEASGLQDICTKFRENFGG